MITTKLTIASSRPGQVLAEMLRLATIMSEHSKFKGPGLLSCYWLNNGPDYYCLIEKGCFTFGDRRTVSVSVLTLRSLSCSPSEWLKSRGFSPLTAIQKNSLASTCNCGNLKLTLWLPHYLRGMSLMCPPNYRYRDLWLIGQWRLISIIIFSHYSAITLMKIIPY